MTPPSITKSIRTQRINGNGNNKNNNCSGKRRGSRMGEAAGECAAVWCCCPCAMMHLLILAVYRIPASLCRKKKRKKLLPKKQRKNSSEENEIAMKSKAEVGLDESTEREDGNSSSNGGKIETLDWDSDMWGRFHGNGFWRSSSRGDSELGIN